MSAKIKVATLTTLLTAFSVYGTALAQSNGDLSGHRASKPLQRLMPQIATATPDKQATLFIYQSTGQELCFYPPVEGI